MFDSPSARHVGRALGRFSCAGVLGLGVCAALPSAANATEPTRQTVVTVGAHSTALCPSGVVLQGLFDITRDITTYYDADGISVRRLSSNRAEGTWTYPNTGAWLASIVVSEVHFDLTTGGRFATGSGARNMLPDGGVAIGVAGLQIFDATGALVDHFGPDTESERAQLCAALGA